MRLDKVDLLDADGRRGPVTLEITDGRIARIADADADDAPRPLVTPSLVDLQVNGGGGRMLNDARSPTDIAAIAMAHRALGTGHILPTLITDTRDTTARIIALAQDCEGLLGLHLEGPHLTVAGAHKSDLLRLLTENDVASYAEAAQRLNRLMITLAPEMADPDQIARLSAAGIIVSLGHSTCDYDTAKAAMAAGASMVTHLFNAMSGLHHRAPGLVGAALDRASAFGIIADGHHVHDAALRLALRAAPDRVIPVSDAMAPTGSPLQRFTFQGREVTAEGTKLSLPDGTLAGARASLLDGLRHLSQATGTPLSDLLPLGFARPLEVLGMPPPRITEGSPADLLQLWPDGRMATFLGDTWNPV